MPILFKASHKQSGFHGLGLFAEEDIPNGAVWWTMQDVQAVPTIGSQNLENIIYNEEDINKELSNLGPQQTAKILHRSMYYQDGEVLIYLRDGTEVMNHSTQPNSITIYNEQKNPKLLKSITIRPIKAGEQITQDYSSFTKRRNNWVQKLYEKLLPERLEFEVKFQIKSTKEK